MNAVMLSVDKRLSAYSVASLSPSSVCSITLLSTLPHVVTKLAQAGRRSPWQHPSWPLWQLRPMTLPPLCGPWRHQQRPARTWARMMCCRLCTACGAWGRLRTLAAALCDFSSAFFSCRCKPQFSTRCAWMRVRLQAQQC